MNKITSLEFRPNIFLLDGVAVKIGDVLNERISKRLTRIIDRGVYAKVSAYMIDQLYVNLYKACVNYEFKREK